MQPALPRKDEAWALAVLRALDILDSDAEAEFDALARVASQVCETPVSLISLTDASRQWFKANVGLDGLTQTPRETAFCTHTVLGKTILEIHDALTDPRFATNPLVSGPQGIRFYAGMPIRMKGGSNIGALCVMDRLPRVLTESQKSVLRDLAGVAAGALESRRDARQRLESMMEATRALAAREAEQRFLIDHLTAGVIVHGADGTVLRSNPRACKLLGLTEAQMRGRQLIAPEWRFLRADGSAMPVSEYPVTQVLTTGEGLRDRVIGVVVPARAPEQAEVTWLICDANPERHDGRTIRQVVVTFVDITALKQMERNLESSERRFRMLFENALDGIMVGRPDGTTLSANPAACATLGMSKSEICRRGRGGIVNLKDERVAAFLEARRLTGRARGEIEMIRANGQHFTVEISSTIYDDGPGQPLSSMIFRDITQRKAAEDKAHQLAYFDELTALPNRRLLADRLLHALAAAMRTGKVGALLFLDLDNFKHINDARGHSIGDALLRGLSARLSECLRAEDTLARVGGDEFVILLDDVGNDFDGAARNAMIVADKFRKALDAPFEIEGSVYSNTGSIGITLFPRPGQSGDDVLREADTAMYRAKAAGRNRIAFFKASMQTEVEERLALEQDLSEALREGQLQAAVQPQFAADGRQVGGEILLRWHHPKRGQVSPAEFIPVAEQTGLILPIGNWVMRQACEALIRLRKIDDSIAISVNVSPRQFLRDDFVDQIGALLGDTGAPGSRLIFEVTEGLLIHNWEEVSARVSALRALGIRFSIDDFGTGYSSLAYLKKLPLYELKIDRSFVTDIPQDPNDVAIVQAILSVARHLKLNVVAEGVETQAQADFLIAGQCDCLQGYLYARPMPLAAWIASLEESARVSRADR